MRDYATIYKHCPKTGLRLFKRLTALKEDMLAVSREFYPLGVAGWERGVESLADKCFHDEDHRLLTTVPITTARKAAAGMLQNLTSKGQPWYYLTVPKNLTDKLSKEKRGVLEKLTEASRYLMARSNCYSSIYRLFMHYMVYGFGCMLVSGADDSSGDIIDTYTLRPGTYALGIGRTGRVNKVVRKFAWTAMEILEEFGKEAVPLWIREMAKNGSEKYITVWNLIEPNYTGALAEFDPVSRACELEQSCCYRSIFWVEGGGTREQAHEHSGGEGRYGILGVDGFDINPIIAPRLDCELGDIYGRGLGIDGLDLARGLQSYRYDILKISGDKAQPALVASSEFKEDGLRCGRGEVNYVQMGQQKQGFVLPVLPNPPSIEDTRNCEIVAKTELETLFYIDAFTAMDLFRDNIGKVTATQINYAKAEGMQKLGAMVSNCECEFLNILVNTIWRWAVKAKVAPLDEKTIATIVEMQHTVAPEYVSNIHQARRLAEMNGIQAWMQNVEYSKSISQDPIADPADVVDFDAVNRTIAEIANVPEDCIRNESDIAAKRKQREQQAKAAQTAEMLDKGAGAVQKLGNTPITEDRLLAPLARAATGLGGS